MAGLIAANVFRRHSPEVIERRSSLPHNHSALLRLRSDSVGHATGIPMRKVFAQKALFRDGRITKEVTLADGNQYSQKVAGVVHPRSISDLEDCERWIAPSNFVELLSKGADIHYSRSIGQGDLSGPEKEPIISTLPMPVMMDLLGWNDSEPNFDFKPIWTATVDLGEGVDVHQTIYFPEPHLPYYRASITGSTLIVEFQKDVADDFLSSQVAGALEPFKVGRFIPIDQIKYSTQPYGKIVPIDESTRRAFILHLTQEFGIYSLGRFATWKPVLLDDLIQDLDVIESLISSGPYSASLQSAGNPIK